MQVGQQGQPAAGGVDVETVERFIEDQQLRIGHQGLTQQGLTRFPGRQVFKPAVQQGADAKLFGQAARSGQDSFTSSWIISAVVRPVSSSPWAEQVGVIGAATRR